MQFSEDKSKIYYKNGTIELDIYEIKKDSVRIEKKDDYSFTLNFTGKKINVSCTCIKNECEERNDEINVPINTGLDHGSKGKI